MGRSRYKTHEIDHLHFVTCTLLLVSIRTIRTGKDCEDQPDLLSIERFWQYNARKYAVPSKTMGTRKNLLSDDLYRLDIVSADIKHSIAHGNRCGHIVCCILANQIPDINGGGCYNSFNDNIKL
jgi:hypothetical protein